MAAKRRSIDFFRILLEVADILRDHGPAWRDANSGHISLDQLKVMSAIERCRTAALAGGRGAVLTLSWDRDPPFPCPPYPAAEHRTGTSHAQDCLHPQSRLGARPNDHQPGG